MNEKIQTNKKNKFQTSKTLIWAKVGLAKVGLAKVGFDLKNALVRRLVCNGALSSCHHQLDVSVPRRAMQCGKYTSSSIRM